MRLSATLLLFTAVLGSFAGPASASDVDLDCGETIARKIDVPGDVDTLSFHARAGEMVAITAVAVPCLGLLDDLEWTLLDPDGDVVPTAAGAGHCTGTCPSSPLPANGKYDIRVRDTGIPGIGVYHVTLEAVSATADGHPNGPPAPVCDGTHTLDRAHPVQGTIAPAGETDTFTFVAKGGEILHVATTPIVADDGTGIEPRWELFDPIGTRVPTAAGTPVCDGICDTAPLPATGTYTLLLSDAGLDEHGGYQLVLDTGTASTSSTTTTSSSTSTTIEESSTSTTIAGGSTTSTSTTIAGGSTTSTSTTIEGATSTTSTTLDASTTTTSSTSTTVEGSSTTSTTLEGATTTSTSTTIAGGSTTSTSTTIEGATTSSTSTTLNTSVTTTSSTSTTVEGSSTTSTTIDGASTTSTSTTLGGSSTSTTSTTPPPTTTTTTLPSGPPPPLALEGVVTPPRAAPPATAIGAATTAPGDRLLLGEPHADAAGPDTGAVYVVDVAGGPTSAGFGRVLETLVSPTPAAGDAFGAAVAALRSGVAVGAPGVDAGAADAGTVYVVDVPGQPPLVIAPPVAVPGGAFGSALAVVGEALAIGAPGAGSVVLVDPVSGAPLLTLAPPAPQAGFGTALAALGPNVVVGAPGSDTSPGKVFVFAGGTGALVLTLESPKTTPGDHFGAAVAVAGNVIVVGAPGSATIPGAVLVFDGTTGTLLRTLTAPAPAPGDGFGASVATAGTSLVVGAPGSGAAYVIDGGTGAVIDVLRAPAGTTGFGDVVVPVGDRVLVGSDAGGVLFAGDQVDAVFRQRLSSDGFGSALAPLGADFLVGAPGTGTVSRVDGKTGAVLATIASPEPGDTGFGFAVAGLAADVAIGSPRANDGQGVTHVFSGATSRLTLQSPHPLAGDQFGWSLATAGDDLIVGAPLAGENDAGIAFLFDGATGARRVTFQKPTPGTGDFFGAAVAADGDEVLIGAPLDSVAAPAAGAVYLFRRDTAALERVLTAPAPAEGDLFGAAVAFAGRHILVGAPLTDAGATDAGAVWVFDRDTGALLFALANPGPQLNDEFGHGVTTVADRIVVGAPLKDGPVARDTGAVYLYDGTGALAATLANPAQGDLDHFGLAIAGSDGTLLVGAPGPARVYRFAVAASGAATQGLHAAVPQAFMAAAVAPAQCGNGIVEGDEACDDGNAIDADDCGNDCTRPACCTLDVPVSSVCDDGNPCTDDLFYPRTGCASLANDQCCGGERMCAEGTCRLCVGCFLFPWDCCDTGSTCLAQSPQCAGTTCLDGAYCECEGGLSCPDEDIPATVAQLFTAACDGLRLEGSVTPDSTPVSRHELRAGTSRVRHVRQLTRKAAGAARKATARGTLSRACGRMLATRIKTVKQSIPKGKALRRCLLSR